MQAVQTKANHDSRAMSITNNALNSVMAGVERISGVAQSEIKIQQEKQNEQYINDGIKAGELAITPEQYNADRLKGTDAFTVAKDKAQQAKVQNNIRRLTDARMAEVAETYATDPVGYRAAATGVQEAIKEELSLNDDGELSVSRAIGESMDRYLPKITQNGYAQAKKEEMTAYNAEFEHLVNQGLNDVRTGNFERTVSLMEDVNNLVDKGIESGVYSADDKQGIIDGIMLEMEEQVVMSTADSANDSINFEGGRKSIEAWRSEAEKGGKFSPGELDAIEGRATQSINQAESAWKRDQKEKKAAMEKAQKKQDKIITVDNYLISGLPMPKNKDNQDAIDDYYAQMSEGVNMATPEGQAAMVELITKTKLMPSKIKEGLKVAALSNNPEMIAQSAEFYSFIADTSPRTIANSMTTNEQVYFENYNEAIRVGYDAEGAIEYANKTTFEEDKNQVATLKARTTQKEYKGSRSAAAKEFVSGQSGFFSGSASMASASAQNVRFENDYNTAYDIAFRKNGGDAEAAAKIANRTIAASGWGVTTVNDSNQLMKFTPEGVYAQNGDDAWISEVWELNKKEIVKDTFGGFDNTTAKLTLVSDLLTERGSQTTWAVMVTDTDKDGVETVEPLYSSAGKPERWYPDVKESKEYKQSIANRLNDWNLAKSERENKNVKERKGATVPRVTKYDSASTAGYKGTGKTYTPNIGGF